MRRWLHTAGLMFGIVTLLLGYTNCMQNESLQLHSQSASSHNPDANYRSGQSRQSRDLSNDSRSSDEAVDSEHIAMVEELVENLPALSSVDPNQLIELYKDSGLPSIEILNDGEVIDGLLETLQSRSDLLEMVDPNYLPDSLRDGHQGAIEEVTGLIDQLQADSSLQDEILSLLRQNASKLTPDF